MLAKVSEMNGHHTIKLAQKLFILISFHFYCLHIIQYDGAVWFLFQSNCKPLEELKVSTVRNGVMKDVSALVNIFTYSIS